MILAVEIWRQDDDERVDRCQSYRVNEDLIASVRAPLRYASDSQAQLEVVVPPAHGAMLRRARAVAARSQRAHQPQGERLRPTRNVKHSPRLDRHRRCLLPNLPLWDQGAPPRGALGALRSELLPTWRPRLGSAGCRSAHAARPRASSASVVG